MMKLPRTIGKTKNLLAASALVLAGFGGGAVLAATGMADAATGSSSSSTTTPDGHGDETALTGTTAAKVRAAALAKYPGASIERVETDADGVYEAHLTTTAGDDLIVQVDESFTITGTETGRGHGGLGGHGEETALTGTTAAKVKAAALA